MKITCDEFIELLAPFANPLRLDYSGRFMYGDTCVAFDVDSICEAMGIAAEVAVEAHSTFGIDSDQVEDVIRLFRNARMDSMGLGYVIYFPQMETTAVKEEAA